MSGCRSAPRRRSEGWIARTTDWSAAPILGSYALETSAYSRITDWPAGGIVGIHGTPNPELLGKAVSHGCVRVHNRDILRLRKLARPGTPIKIVA